MYCDSISSFVYNVLCMYLDIDLQMAATFGKMLLEKNEQLQHELQHLQKAAEETTLENQVCILLIVMKMSMGTIAASRISY